MGRQYRVCPFCGDHLDAGEICDCKQEAKEPKGDIRMSKSTVELPDGGYATETEALSALAREAHQRGISYGNLAASTTERERTEIIRDFCTKKWKNRKKGKNGR